MAAVRKKLLALGSTLISDEPVRIGGENCNGIDLEYSQF
jgi:hypothetical protein